MIINCTIKYHASLILNHRSLITIGMKNILRSQNVIMINFKEMDQFEKFI